ncbi:MAG: ankyrin repeat domain-containing protein [Legionella sp.]|nr:ankyrin repeat domain-containing protein [Legionella sp.]
MKKFFCTHKSAQLEEADHVLNRYNAPENEEIILDNQPFKSQWQAFIDLSPPFHSHLLKTFNQQDKFQLDETFDLEEEGITGTTPLINAAMSNHITAVRELCKAKANILAKEPMHSNTALLWAIANSNIEAALILLDSNLVEDRLITLVANQPCIDGHTPLILAVAKGWHHANAPSPQSLTQSNVILKLLELGVDVNAQDNTGRTALHYAFLHRDFRCIQYLIKAGADIEIIDKNKKDPSIMGKLSYELAHSILTETVSAGLTCCPENWYDGNEFDKNVEAFLFHRSITAAYTRCSLI